MKRQYRNVSLHCTFSRIYDPLHPSLYPQKWNKTFQESLERKPMVLGNGLPQKEFQGQGILVVDVHVCLSKSP
jgi:hypothetical protein